MRERLPRREKRISARNVLGMGVAALAVGGIIAALNFGSDRQRLESGSSSAFPRTGPGIETTVFVEPISIGLNGDNEQTLVPDPDNRLNVNGNSFEIEAKIRPFLPASPDGSQQAVTIAQKATPGYPGYFALLLFFEINQDGSVSYRYVFRFPYVEDGKNCKTHTIGGDEIGENYSGRESFTAGKASPENFIKDARVVRVSVNGGKITIEENGRTFAEEQLSVTGVHCENAEPLRIGGEGVGVDQLNIASGHFPQLRAKQGDRR